MCDTDDTGDNIHLIQGTRHIWQSTTSAKTLLQYPPRKNERRSLNHQSFGISVTVIMTQEDCLFCLLSYVWT